MSRIAIKANHLSKKYRIGQREPYNTFRDAIIGAIKAPYHLFRNSNNGSNGSEYFYALKDISFEVPQGEVVGIIGRNGAGKSTLLKILSKITTPTEGSIEFRGRVGSLLEVGTGFHPELTGRENIFLSGSILGMRRKEINDKFDEIVKFAEIEKFLETPVKRYSSGMYVRLAFAVAAHLDPEILLVDEVLAVGDAQFQKKCLGKMENISKEGRTILFVSHNMGAVSALCTKTIYLANGQIYAIGRTEDIVAEYLSGLLKRESHALSELRSSGRGEEIWFNDIKLISHDGSDLMYGSPIEFQLTIQSDIAAKDLSIGSSIFDSKGICIGTLFTRETFCINSGAKRTLKLIIENLALAPGDYYAGISVGKGGHTSSRYDYDVIIGAPAFKILPISDKQNHISYWSSNWGSIVIQNTKLDIVDGEME